MFLSNFPIFVTIWPSLIPIPMFPLLEPLSDWKPYTPVPSTGTILSDWQPYTPVSSTGTILSDWQPYTHVPSAVTILWLTALYPCSLYWNHSLWMTALYPCSLCWNHSLTDSPIPMFPLLEPLSDWQPYTPVLSAGTFLSDWKLYASHIPLFSLLEDHQSNIPLLCEGAVLWLSALHPCSFCWSCSVTISPLSLCTLKELLCACQLYTPVLSEEAIPDYHS